MKLKHTIAVLVATSMAAHAAFVYPDFAFTDGGSFNAGFTIDNIIDGGHTAPTDTEDASSATTGIGYATANPPAAGRPVTIAFDFTTATDLNEFYLWNHTFNGAAAATANGIDDFTLTFFDGVGGTGSQIGVVFADNAARAPATGPYPAEEFSFATRSGVRSVLLVANDHNGTGFIGIREVAFNAVPEPSSSAPLIGLGGLALVFRRRK